MMGRWIVNLDWGSSSLKICAFQKKRAGQDRLLLVGGRLQGRELHAHPSPRLPSGRSVKAAFLTGELKPELLHAVEGMSESVLCESLVRPLADHLRSDSTPFELFLNLHVPLQLTSPAFLACSDVFIQVNSESRSVVPAYRTFEEWALVLKRPQQPVECRWALWIMERIQTQWMREGLDTENLYLALIPESLTCVQDLVGNLRANTNRQFLILDVGHFTTDYTLVAFVHSESDKTFIRQAGSFFDMGSESMAKVGFEKWLERLGKLLAQRVTPTSERGIEAYMNLEVLLAGGGSLGMKEAHRKQLQEMILAWARRNPLFASAPSRGKGRVEMNVPLHRMDLFKCLDDALATVQSLDKVDADLFLPAIASCGFADARTSLNVPGSESWSTLRERWHHQPSPPLTPSYQPLQSPTTQHRNSASEEGSPRGRATYYTKVVATPSKGKRAKLVEAFQALSQTEERRAWGLNILSTYANEGDLEAIYLLGRFEALGVGGGQPRNRPKGITLLKRAAELGHRGAQQALRILRAKRKMNRVPEPAGEQ